MSKQLIRKNLFRLLGVLLLVSFFGLSSCQNSSGPSIIECGGGAKFPCPPGMFCDYAQGCGGVDRLGQCRRQPPTCPSEDIPVCGCDGKTYDSPCYANASGISIAYEGACMAKEQDR